MTTLGAVTAKWGVHRRVAASAALALGLVNCSTNLSDLLGGDGLESENPLDQTPGWSRGQPQQGASGEGGAGGQAGDTGLGKGGAGGRTPEGETKYDTWCTARKGDFCADFDGENPLARFGGGVEGLTPPVVSTGFDFSEPSALLVDAPKVENRTDNFAAKITQHFGRAATGFRLDFQFSPELVDNQRRAVIAAIEFLGNGAAPYSLRLAYDDGWVVLEEVQRTPTQALGVKRLASTALPTGEQVWSHLFLDATFEANATAYFKVLDDRQGGEISSTSVRLTPAPAMSPVPSLVIGIADGERPHTGWRLRYDNVLLALYPESG